MTRSACIALCVVFSSLLPGCQAGQLYVASNTVVGLHANVNTAQTSGRLQIGYDREFVTVVPRSVSLASSQEGVGSGSNTAAREAMAAMSCSELEVNGIFVTRFVENLATGRAALNFAKALQDPDVATAESAAEFFSCSASAQ